jgi:flagellar hook-associated protein 3 FlgL
MRVTSTSYYNNIYGENNKLNQQLFDVNKQIASGQKIQYAHENPGVFIDTLRLDDEITTLTQTKNSTDNAYKLSSQTDTTIGDIVKTLSSLKVKLINAGTDSQSDASLEAITKEMKGLKNHLLTLANTSIGGQFLFSGTATAQKPIDENGIYRGNDKNMEAFLGSGLKQKYNITGTQLFLGEENNVNRTITTNIPQFNLTNLYANPSEETYITPASTIGDLMGNVAGNSTAISHFYVQGTKNDGEIFKTKISLNSTDTIDTLLRNISSLYGSNQTDVTLNPHGQIEIVDKKSGSSKLEFHMVGATDFDATGIDEANVTNITSLQSGTTDFKEIITTPIATNNLYIKEFTNSGKNNVNGAAVGGGAIVSGDLTINGIDIGALTVLASDSDTSLADAINSKKDLTGVSATISSGKLLLNSMTSDSIIISGNTTNQTATEAATGLSFQSYNTSGLNYDKIPFSKDGASLTSNMPQIIKSDNSYATNSTLLVSVASGNTLNNEVFKMQGLDINGNPFDIDINLLTAGSTVTINQANGITPPVNFNIENVAGNATPANELTYQQLMDVMNIAVTGQYPSAVLPATYTQALESANTLGSVSLNKNGQIVFEDKMAPSTSASISLYDSSADDFSASSNSVLTFNANSAITIRDPKIDLFSQIDKMIQAVAQGKTRADGTDSRDPRNIGIQNSIQMIDDLTDHVSRLQTESGSYSQVLRSSSDRSSLLIVNSKMLRSEIIDTDIAEATLRMQQLSLNYQAMLSSISKVSKLSLVNYL